MKESRKVQSFFRKSAIQCLLTGFVIVLCSSIPHIGCRQTATSSTVDTTCLSSLSVRARYDTVVSPNSFIRLDGTYDSADEIREIRWIIPAYDTVIYCTDPETRVTAPAFEDSNFYCIFSVTTQQNRCGTDTVTVWVTNNPQLRISRPRGGEIYHPGDTIILEMFPVDNQVGIDVYFGDFSFDGLGLNYGISPLDYPEFKIAIPLLTDVFRFNPDKNTYESTPEPPVSDSCTVVISQYSYTENFAESEGYFSIRPRN